METSHITRNLLLLLVLAAAPGSVPRPRGRGGAGLGGVEICRGLEGEMTAGRWEALSYAGARWGK